MTRQSINKVARLYGINELKQKARNKFAAICPDCGHLRRTNRTKKSLLIFAKTDGVHLVCYDGLSREGSECGLKGVVHPWDRQVPMVETHAYLESQKAEAWEDDYDMDWRQAI